MIQGGDYRAAQNQDGTWDVLDVPVCAEGEIPRYDRFGKVVDHWPATREWFERIIQTNAKRERVERFMGRLHVHHHDDGDQVEAAGFIRPRRVGLLETLDEDGETQMLSALHCDLLGIPEWTYEEIRNRGLPYRSIECNDCESGFLDSVALMPTKAPFFKLPMLTIGSEEHRADTVPSGNIPGDAYPIAARKGRRLVASRSYGKHLQALARFDMPDPDDKPNGDNGDDKTAKGGDGDGIDVGSVVKAIESGSISIADFDAIEAAMSAARGGGDDDAVVDPGPAEIAARKREAKMAARLSIQETKTAKLEEGRSIDKAVKAGMGELEGHAIGTPSEFEKKLRAHLVKYGAESKDDFVTLAKDAYPKADQDPDADTDPIRIAAGVAPGGDVPDEVLAYTDPDERAAAARAHAMWKSGTESGHVDVPAEDFIRRAVARVKRHGKMAIT